MSHSDLTKPSTGHSDDDHLRALGYEPKLDRKIPNLTRQNCRAGLSLSVANGRRSGALRPRHEHGRPTVHLVDRHRGHRHACSWRWCSARSSRSSHCRRALPVDPTAVERSGGVVDVMDLHRVHHRWHHQHRALQLRLCRQPVLRHGRGSLGRGDASSDTRHHPVRSGHRTGVQPQRRQAAGADQPDRFGGRSDLHDPVVGLYLMVFQRRNDWSVFFDTFNAGGEGSYLTAFIGASLVGLYLYYGFEACGEVAEETPNPARSIPAIHDPHRVGRRRCGILRLRRLRHGRAEPPWDRQRRGREPHPTILQNSRHSRHEDLPGDHSHFLPRWRDGPADRRLPPGLLFRPRRHVPG